MFVFNHVHKPLRSSAGVRNGFQLDNCSFCVSVSFVKLLSFLHIAYMFIPQTVSVAQIMDALALVFAQEAAVKS